MIKLSIQKHTISEAATILDYEPHVLRFYEGEFDIHVPRDKSNRREYTIKEIETFQYIKDLKNKGYNNSQIKQILKSPTVEDEISGETAPVPFNENSSNSSNEANNLAIREVAMHLDSLNDVMYTNFSKINETICKLNNTIDEFKKDLELEDKDVLISENAKLKMKLKEKTYELVDIKEKYSQLEQKKFVFKRIFR